MLDVPIRPPCFCVPIVVGPNPSMFAQITTPNLDITMPALYLKWMKWCRVIKAEALEQLYHLAVHQWHHFLLRTLFGHLSLLSRTSWSPVVYGGAVKEESQKNLKTLSDLNMDSCGFHWVSQCRFWISVLWISLLGLFVQLTSIVSLIRLASEHSFKSQ